MDAANGSIEYDIVKQTSRNTSSLSLSGPLDARCPQAQSFGILRCLGHQHIGGRCMRLVDTDTGNVICSSCPTYGNASEPGAVGNERGYLVSMSQAVMQEAVQIQPGQNVTLVSDYNASEDHFGVMALFFLDLVGFDSSCPGPVTAATGGRQARRQPLPAKDNSLAAVLFFTLQSGSLAAV